MCLIILRAARSHKMIICCLQANQRSQPIKYLPGMYRSLLSQHMHRLVTEPIFLQIKYLQYEYKHNLHNSFNNFNRCDVFQSMWESEGCGCELCASSQRRGATWLRGPLFNKLILWRKNLIPLPLLFPCVFLKVKGSLRWRGTLANYTADRSVTGKQ